MTTAKKITVKPAKKASRVTTNKTTKKVDEQPLKKSKITLFWETIPEGAIEIVDMDAILA